MKDSEAMESELRKFVPVVAPAEVRASIGAALAAGAGRARRGVWSDRCLMSAMGMGVAAAVTIVTLLVMDGGGGAAAVPAPNQASAQMQAREYLAQLAAGKDPGVLPGGAH